MYRIHSRNLLVLVPTYCTLPRPCTSVWPMSAYHTSAYLCVLRTPIQSSAPTTYVLHSLVLQYSRSAPVHDIDG